MSIISERSPLTASQSKTQLNNLFAIQNQANVEGCNDEFKSSPVRRTFCLIVLFDLAICFIFWILYIQMSKAKGNDTTSIYKMEVLNYTFNRSLFDMPMLSSARFVFLEITYGCIKSKQPWFLAASTTCSSIFVVAKMVQFNLPTNTELLTKFVGYVLILIAFIISWTETMFLIYRVLPKEKAAEKVLEYHRYLSEQYGSSQQTLAALSDILTGTTTGRTSKNSISEDEEFFSPRQTRSGSPTHIINKEIVNLTKILREKASTICNNTKDWRYLAGDAVQGFVTCKEMAPFSGKLFKFECFLNVPSEVLYKDLVFNAENTPLWNPHVRNVKKIETISENIDILYNLSNEALKGYIAPRDFVLLRMWGIASNRFFIYMTSHLHPDCPPQPNITRGEYGIGAIHIEKSSIDHNQTKCIWIMNYDLKGNMFRSIVDRAMPKILQEMICNLRKHCLELNNII